MRDDNSLTAERVREVLRYDPDTGLFVWLAGQRAGRVAGCDNGDGYIFIRVDRHRLYAHRLAFFYMTGEWPSGVVDHKDRRPQNNTFTNLRVASHRENLFNRGATKANKCGLKGVSRHRRMWRATIKYSGKQIHLGMFITKENAAEAYVSAARRFHGAFAFHPPNTGG